MSRSINGYIELNTGHEKHWIALINIRYLINLTTNDQNTYTMLFGFQSFLKWRNSGFEPVFKKSAFPDNVSKEVGIESGVYDENTYEKGAIIRDYYYPYFSDGYVISYAEIEAINWDETNSEGEARRRYLTPNWKTVFDLMEVLAGNRRDKNVRLILWMT